MDSTNRYCCYGCYCSRCYCCCCSRPPPCRRHVRPQCFGVVVHDGSDWNWLFLWNNPQIVSKKRHM